MPMNFSICRGSRNKTPMGIEGPLHSVYFHACVCAYGCLIRSIGKIWFPRFLWQRQGNILFRLFLTERCELACISFFFPPKKETSLNVGIPVSFSLCARVCVFFAVWFRATGRINTIDLVLGEAEAGEGILSCFKP